MKTVVKILMLFLVVVAITGCGAKEANTGNSAVNTSDTTGSSDTTGPSEPELSESEQWAKANGLGPWTPAEEDWDAVEAAAIEEGSVVVYANSSKFEKLFDAWNALYPEIALDGGDTDDIAIKMQAEQESGNVVGDVWFNSDGHILYGEFVPKQWIWAYVPPGVNALEVTEERPFMLARRSVDVIGYNQEIYTDGCPLENWWQLTEPTLAGKFFMEDPMADMSTTAKITLIIEHADQMAAAYEQLYGKDWTADEAYSSDLENAGYLFLRKLAQNEPGIQPGGDEVDAAFATMGMDPSVEPGYGWTGYSSYENTLDGELAMAPCLGLEPVIGILKANYLGIAAFAPHPNAAKLFLKFMTTQDGFDPWNKIGTYPGVEGLSAVPEMPPREELALWPSDDMFAYQNASQVRDFWALSLLGQ